MVKSTLFASSTLLLVFLFVSATHAGNPSAGLDEACKKTPDPDFCAMLLQPSASEFSDGDPKKMGFAAINATIDKARAVKTYMAGKAVRGASNKEVKRAIMDCVEQVGHCEGSLKVAVRELNFTGEANAPRKLGKAIPIKMIEIATLELTGCQDALKKSEAARMAAGGENADVTRQALRSVNETLLACSIVKAFVTP